jgi:hypothetical protein
MRTLWHALALLAKNEAFRAEVKEASDVETREDQPNNLQAQPTFQALQRLDHLFTGQQLYLSAYELAEINRWVRNDAGMGQIAEFWKALGVESKVKDCPSGGFMAAIGAMAIDAELRFRAWYEKAIPQSPDKLPNGKTILENHGFTLTRDETTVLAELNPGGKADNLCKEWFRSTWSGSPCTSLATAYPGWVHSNA